MRDARVAWYAIQTQAVKRHHGGLFESVPRGTWDNESEKDSGYMCIVITHTGFANGGMCLYMYSLIHCWDARMVVCSRHMTTLTRARHGVCNIVSSVSAFYIYIDGLFSLPGQSGNNH